MNFLNGKRVYLCGQMFVLDDHGGTWRDLVTPKLQAYGVTVDDPVKVTAFAVSEVGEDKKRFQQLAMQEDFAQLKDSFWPVVHKDLRCVDKADFLILNYERPDRPTTGTIHELVVANYEKKPILMKYNNKMLEHFNPWMATFIKNGHFFSEWNDLFSYLNKVNDGIIDTSLWL